MHIYRIYLSKKNIDVSDVSIVGNNIYLPFTNCKIMSCKNILIFYMSVNSKKYPSRIPLYTYIKFDMITNKFTTVDLTSICNFENICNKKYSNGLRKNIYSVDLYNSHKILFICMDKIYILYDFMKDSYELLDNTEHIVNILSFDYNGCEYRAYLTKSKSDVGIDKRLCIHKISGDFERAKYKNVDCKNMIKIGTKDELVKMSLNLLKYRSCFIRSLCDDMEVVDNSLISDCYKDITIYKEYVESNNFMDKVDDYDKIYRLYSICNFLQDVDVNYLAEFIVMYVKSNNLNIDEAFKWIDLLYGSTCDEQLDVLIFVVKIKFGDILFNEKISDDLLMLNNYIKNMIGDFVFTSDIITII